MAEVIGAFASCITLAALFKTCIDAFDLFQAGKNKDIDLRRLLVKLNIEKCRLYTWGEAMGLTTPTMPGHKPLLESSPFQSLVRDALEIVVHLLHDSDKIRARYGCLELENDTALLQDNCEIGPVADLAGPFSNFSILSRSNRRSTSHSKSLISRTRWAIHDKKAFAELIGEVKDLVDGIQCITEPIFTSAKQTGMMISAIQQIQNIDTLEIISEVCHQDHRDISDAASARLDILTIGTSQVEEIGKWIDDTDEATGNEDLSDRPAFKFGLNKDEYDVDFEDLRIIALVRWKEMIAKAEDELSYKNRTLTKPADDSVVAAEIDEKLRDRSTDRTTDRFLLYVKPILQTLKTVFSSFTLALSPYELDFNVVWGVLSLNIWLPLETQSPNVLRQTTEWVSKLRRALERFNRVYRLGFEDNHEAILSLIDMLEHTLAIMVESARYLRYSASRQARVEDILWEKVQQKINEHQNDIEDTTKHLLEMNNYSVANQQKNIRNLELRHQVKPDDHDEGRFPLVMLPYQRKESFYGRSEELNLIDKYLRPDKTKSLRTYSIYGRRGIGKTEIALEYAYLNPSKFDAVFWIGCETSLSLRTSFTEMAIRLYLPGADNKRNHEENLLSVQRWLKNTKKKWLMIFDNAERDSDVILRNYWPMGANGSILITSRDYFNFMKDVTRNGQTVRRFDASESWDLLLKLLGKDWSDRFKNGKLKEIDIDAAKSWVGELGGLALSVQTAARLISRSTEISGRSIAELYSIFRSRSENLPVRQIGARSEVFHTLDCLFDMTFRDLSTDATSLLSVLALLSPDEIPIELFLPRRQSALEGKLAFAKQESPIFVRGKDSESESSSVVTLSSIINLSPRLSIALEELRSSQLIRWEHRTIAVHRVVQEAMNYHSYSDLQQSFDSAIRVVYEVHLAKKVSRYRNSELNGRLKTDDEFVELLCNATWYLYEMSDYDLSNQVIEIAKSACLNKESHLFSRLCNTHGCNCQELNKGDEARQSFMSALKIRERFKGESYLGYQATSYHNMGNIEVAATNYREGLEYYHRAAEIYLAGGDTSACKLGLVYTAIGRYHQLQGDFKYALMLYSQAEQLFTRTIGDKSHFTAYCYYGYGNLEFEQQLYESAIKSYEACLRIALSELPRHPITVAAYYSLGCTAFAMGNVERAKGYLNRARNIAELRSPGSDDGAIARILWKTAMVLKNNPAGTSPQDNEEADSLMDRAYVVTAALTARSEGPQIREAGDLNFTSVDARAFENLEKDSYDLVIPAFF